MEDNILEFYLNKFYCITNIDEINIDSIPPILRRRMSTLDKVCISLLDKTFSDNIQNIIYSSQFGEVDRLLKIIDQYSELKEVSPNLFSASVHNYPVGFFLHNNKKPIPYTALSSCDNTISSGILASVISKFDNNIFCYCDVNNNKLTSFAINISKHKNINSIKYKITTQNNRVSDKFDNYIDLFSGKRNSINTPLYAIEREIND